MADGREEATWTYHAKEHETIKSYDFGDESLLRTWVLELKPKVVVDLGCGSGLWKNLFEGSKYIGIDQNKAMIDVAKTRWPNEDFRVVEWDNPSIPDKSVDMVFTSAVVQHNKHDEKDKVMQAIVRMLKKGGYYLATETTFRPDNYGHVFPGQPFNDDLTDGYSFTAKGWEVYMKKFGLKPVKYNGISEYLFKKL